MLGFSISVSDRKFIKDITDICQILPVQRGYLTDKAIESYYPTSSSKNNILIHTSYMCRAFSPVAFTYESKIKDLIRQYIKLSKRIKNDSILIHGPATVNEYNNFDLGIQLINSVIKEETYTGTIHLEIPSISKDLLTKHEDKYKFHDEYIDKIVKSGFGIVFDTAHTFNNSLTNDEVIKLMKKYDKYVTWIHLNGNLRPQLTSDKHCVMFDEKNLIKDHITFCKEIAKLDKKCITETIHPDYSDWEDFCKQTGFKLVSKECLSHL